MKVIQAKKAIVTLVAMAMFSCEQPAAKVESILYPTGKLHKIILYKGSHKKIVEYSEDGYLFMESNYIDNQAEGTFKTYHRGRLSSVENFENGKLNGEFIVYDPDCCGLIMTQGFSKNGKQDGIWVYYFRGQLRKVTNYRNGEEDENIYENTKLDPASQDFAGDSIACICSDNPRIYPASNR